MQDLRYRQSVLQLLAPPRKVGLSFINDTVKPNSDLDIYLHGYLGVFHRKAKRIIRRLLTPYCNAGHGLAASCAFFLQFTGNLTARFCNLTARFFNSHETLLLICGAILCGAAQALIMFSYEL